MTPSEIKQILQTHMSAYRLCSTCKAEYDSCGSCIGYDEKFKEESIDEIMKAVIESHNGQNNHKIKARELKNLENKKNSLIVKTYKMTERFRLAEVDLNCEIDDLTIGKLEKMNLQEIIKIYEYLKQYFKGRD